MRRAGHRAQGDQIGGAEPLANYTEAFTARQSDFRRRPDRQRLQDRRAPRREQGPGLSVLWLGHQEADPLHPRQSQTDVRGGRRSLDEVLKAQVFMTDLKTSTPSTRSGRNTSRSRRRAPPSARPGSWSRVRWSRSISSAIFPAKARSGGDHLEQSEAARQLYRGVPRRRPGVRGGPDRFGLLDRARERSAASIRRFRITARSIKKQPATSSTI